MKKLFSVLAIVILATGLFAALPPAGMASGQYSVDDAYTVSLLHMNGDDNSTTFIDESGKAVTPYSNAQIYTAESVFGGASGIFDGTGDYLSIPDSADWRLDGGSNSNTWTIDYRIMFSGDPGTALVGFVQQYVDTNNFWAVILSNNSLYVQLRSGGTTLVNLPFAFNPAGNTWYHIAIVKNGTSGYMAFVDGAQVGTTQTDTDPIPDLAGAFWVARYTSSAGVSTYLDGWIDELRVSKGIARWTSNFTPPAAEYTGDDVAATQTAAYNQTQTALALTQTAEYNQTQTALALTQTYFDNQTATALALTQTYEANQTATALALTQTYEANQTATALALTQTYEANQTATALALTATADYLTSAAVPPITATYVTGLTQTAMPLTQTASALTQAAGALTAAVSIGTPYYVSTITYGDLAVFNVGIAILVILVVAGLIYLVRTFMLGREVR